MSSHLEQSIFGDADHLDSRGRFQRRRRPHRRPRWKGLLALFLALVVVGGAAYGSVQFVKPLYDRLTAPKDYPGPGTGSVKVTVHAGDVGRDIAATLVKADVVKTTGAFTDAANADPKAAQSIQPGVYTMKLQMKGTDALKALTDPKNRTVAGVTIREGLWASEIYPILSKETGVPLADYVAAAKNPAIGLPASAKGNIEGYLFPDTYQFPEKATAVQQLQAMVKAAVANLRRAGATDATMERTLTLASIIEAEARKDVDRPKVARVILNRLSRSGPPPYGYLQLDSTVSYGARKRAVTTTDGERGDANPWNTYVHPGLPAGPISNPGAKSMQAATHPAVGPWLYFVAVNPETGETKYAVTKAEHDAYVREFQAWCQSHKGKC